MEELKQICVDLVTDPKTKQISLEHCKILSKFLKAIPDIVSDEGFSLLETFTETTPDTALSILPSTAMREESDVTVTPNMESEQAVDIEEVNTKMEIENPTETNSEQNNVTVTPNMDSEQEAAIEEVDVEVEIENPTETDSEQQQTVTPSSHESLRTMLREDISRKKRVISLPGPNGRQEQVIVFRPSTYTVDAFIEKARRSYWVEKLLPNDTYVAGMCHVLAKRHPKIFAEVAGASINKIFSTAETLALAKDVALNDKQSEKLRGWMRSKGVVMEMNQTVLRQIDIDVGIAEGSSMQFGTYEFFHKDKDPKECPYWNSCFEEDFLNEIEMVVWMKVVVVIDRMA